MAEGAEKQFGLSLADITVIQEVIAQFSEVSKAVIFGSRAKGTHERGKVRLFEFMDNKNYNQVRRIGTK